MHCDIALVWGDIYKKFFCEEYGYPESNVKIVGHPPLDPVFQLKKNPPDLFDKRKFFHENIL